MGDDDDCNDEGDGSACRRMLPYDGAGPDLFRYLDTPKPPMGAGERNGSASMAGNLGAGEWWLECPELLNGSESYNHPAVWSGPVLMGGSDVE